jgi:transposase
VIEALIAGESDPAKLASLANYRLKTPQEKLREALRGRVTKHHRFLLRLHINQIDALDAAIATIDQQVEAGIAPFRAAVEQVSSIPGIRDIGAQVIVSEIGTDMSRFPSDGHLISWAGLCPRNDETAGKRRSNRLRKGAPWLKTTLVQCAWAVHVVAGPAFVELGIDAGCPTTFSQFLPEDTHARLHFRVCWQEGH